TTTTSGVGNILRAFRVPTTSAAGTKYYDITFAFTQDAAGKPVLAPSYPKVVLSPTLLVGQFKAGKYKDGDGNVYTVGGPGAAAGGRTSWSILLTKRCASCGGTGLSGSWTTGPIAGHPIQPTLKAQGITSTGFSWGSARANSIGHVWAASDLSWCESDAVGFAQGGNVLSLNGYCDHTSVQTGVLALNLCTTADPCP
ncbi:MAG: hypothetical protein HOO93_15480, partial [Methyloglobulus sp.]|nr:hypothetical protein [Methyloglobulus sp.]